MNYDSWRTNEDPSWMKHDGDDNIDTDNDSRSQPREEGILACGHDYDKYCKCNDNYLLETEIQDYHWKNI